MMKIVVVSVVMGIARTNVEGVQKHVAPASVSLKLKRYKRKDKKSY